MFKKMTIVAILVALALPVLAAPEQERGTWGKPKGPAAIAAPEGMREPALQLNRWLDEFNTAYESRNGEKMERLLGRLDAVKSKMPEMPRFDNWINEVKEAHKAEDVEKMGALLEKANGLRESLNTQLQQNRRARQGQGPREGIAPDQDQQPRPMGPVRNQRQLQNQPGRPFENTGPSAEQPQGPGQQGRAFRGQGRDMDARGQQAAPYRGQQFRQDQRGQQERPDVERPMMQNRQALRKEFQGRQQNILRGQRGQRFNRDNNARPFFRAPRQQGQRNRIENFRPYAGMRFEGLQNRFGQQPMQPNFGPRSFTPRGQMGYGQMIPQGRFNRPNRDAAPMAPQGYGRPNLGQNRMMHPNFAPNFNGQWRGFGGQMNEPERVVPRDFWQD
ncbi:MAG: hypothetical protein JXB18_11260 [Sedimentisphaerales bacterium]|nr:hypothetical protein [Sedimentisphaerales bacterium]